MKLPERSQLKKFAIPIISGIVIVLCILIFTLRFSTKTELEESTRRLSEEVDSMRYNLKNLQNLEDQLAEMKRFTEEVRSRTIEPEDSAANTAYFYGFETDKMRIQNLQQRQSSGGKGAGKWKMRNFSTTLFTLQAEGNYRQIIDLTNRIRAGEKLVRILNFSIVPIGKGEGNLRKISMTVQALSTVAEEKKSK